jgi:GxxExxY protein
MALITTPSTEVVIGCAIRVHSQVGPGLFESVYEACLALEMRRAGLKFDQQKVLPINYEGLDLAEAFRADFIVENELVVEIKSIDRLMPVHTRQVLTYMRLSGVTKGLLLNFNVSLLKNGLKSLVL